MVLFSAIDRMVAEAPFLSGSMARAQTPPRGSTVSDQNIEPARLRPTGQPERTFPSGPMTTRLPPVERLDGARTR